MTAFWLATALAAWLGFGIAGFVLFLIYKVVSGVRLI